MYDNPPFFEYQLDELLVLKIFVNHSHVNDDDELLSYVGLWICYQKEKQTAKSIHIEHEDIFFLTQKVNKQNHNPFVNFLDIHPKSGSYPEIFCIIVGY
jgi:hypothetical protein